MKKFLVNDKENYNLNQFKDIMMSSYMEYFSKKTNLVL